MRKQTQIDAGLAARNGLKINPVKTKKCWIFEASNSHHLVCYHPVSHRFVPPIVLSPMVLSHNILSPIILCAIIVSPVILSAIILSKQWVDRLDRGIDG